MVESALSSSYSPSESPMKTILVYLHHELQLERQAVRKLDSTPLPYHLTQHDHIFFYLLSFLFLFQKPWLIALSWLMAAVWQLMGEPIFILALSIYIYLP